MRLLAFLGAFWLCSASVLAQNELDALRYANRGIGVSARAVGMGSAYSAVADDFSALFFNPAGLGQIKRFELSLGIDNSSLSSASSYLGTVTSSSISATAPNSLALVIPVPTFQGSFVIAGGFQRLRSFDRNQGFEAFNEAGSMVSALQSSRPIFGDDFFPLVEDLAGLLWSTYLLDLDGDRYINPAVQNRVQQSATVNESGGMSLYNIGLSVEIAPALFAGLTLNHTSGNYQYRRRYREVDNTNAVWGFESLSLVDNIDTELSGWGVKGGILYRMDAHFRFSLTVESPYQYTMTELFSSDLEAAYDFRRVPVFRNGVLIDSTRTSTDGFGGDVEYSLSTPFIFGLGFSYEESWMTLGVDFSYTDWRDMRFSSRGTPLTGLNEVIRDELIATVAGSVGLEIRPLELPFRFRAGYGFDTSPFRNKLSSPDTPTDFVDARQRVSFGLGIVLRKTLTIDVAYLYQWQNDEDRPYRGAPIVTDQLRQRTLLLTAGFRF